jgi:predicted O-methyltransferase YrrM
MVRIAFVELRAAAAMHGLSLRVAWFLLRARLRARRAGDVFAIVSSLPPADVARLLAVAGDRREVAELGTAHGWTAAALVLAHPDRHVISFDPIPRPPREGYLALAGPEACSRIECVTAVGSSAPRPVDLLYIDSSHEREETLAEVHAWRPVMGPGSLIVFDDYDNPTFPGVAEAIVELGLSGEPSGRFFVHRV